MSLRSKMTKPKTEKIKWKRTYEEYAGIPKDDRIPVYSPIDGRLIGFIKNIKPNELVS